MTPKLGDTAPDFEAETTEGPIRFDEWIGASWAVLFSHPTDFTPVCTTELGYMAKIEPDFDRRGVKIIGLSVDDTADQEAWAKDIEETQGAAGMLPARRLRRGEGAHARRQPNRPQRLRDRPRQDDQAHPRLPDDDGHRRLRHRRRSQDALPRLGGTQALHSHRSPTGLTVSFGAVESPPL